MFTYLFKIVITNTKIFKATTSKNVITGEMMTVVKHSKLCFSAVLLSSSALHNLILLLFYDLFNPDELKSYPAAGQTKKRSF